MAEKFLNKGRKKLCKLHAEGGTMPKIAKMVFGTGGAEEDAPKEVTGDETALYNQILEKEITEYKYSEDEMSCIFSGLLEKAELAGEKISELGLVDSEGDLIFMKTFMPKGKDADFTFEFTLEEIWR